MKLGTSGALLKKRRRKVGVYVVVFLVIGDVKMFCHSRFHSNALLKYVINFAIQCTIHKCLHHSLMLIRVSTQMLMSLHVFKFGGCL